jgi:hypothetical protein
VTTEPMLVLKPKGISHAEAASLGCVALTALQCFEKMELDGGVAGKTVLITSGRKSSRCRLQRRILIDLWLMLCFSKWEE